MSGNYTTIFDIETGPAPIDEIEAVMPEFFAPGNLKDPAKIEAAIEKKRTEFVEKAALSPLTGRVLAIGAVFTDLTDNPEYQVVCGDSEQHMISWFWDRVEDSREIIGFNSNHFDVPFMIRRSWALGIDVPIDMVDKWGRIERGFSLDLMDTWRLGDRMLFTSLDTIAKFFGVGEKTGDGAQFADLLKIDEEAALEYLENDVQLTYRIAKRMGVISNGLTIEEEY